MLSGLSLSLRRQTVARWIKKTKDPIYAASKTFTSSKDKQAKIEGIEGDTPSKWQLEKGGVAILI